MGRVINTILITGATGYLGSRLLKKLIHNNYKVCVVKRPASNIGDLENTEGVSLYNCDHRSISQLFSENTIDLVIHTATAYGRRGESLHQIKEANLDFPLLILDEAIKNNVPYFINTGTSLPYLTNQYALFKNQFSECLEFFQQQITSVNILLEHFFGTGDDNSKFITGMIDKMKSNYPAIELTLGTQIRDFIFIEDVIDAYFVIINEINNLNGFVNIPLGSGEGVTIREIVETIQTLTNSSSVLKFGAVKMRENELMKSDADISILKSFGWAPKYSLIEGLKITINS